MQEVTSVAPAPQGSVVRFLVGLVDRASAVPEGGDELAVLAAAVESLGGGSRARAVLAAMGVALDYAAAPIEPGSSVLDEEDAAAVAANRMVQPLERDRLQARIDAVEAATQGASTCPVEGCGAVAHSRGRAGRTLTGRHGPMLLSFRVSKCTGAECGHSFAVAAQPLGFGPQRFTPGCAEAVTLAATALPHGKAVAMIGQLLKLEVSEHASQDLVEARGAALLALDEAAAAKHAPLDASGLQRAGGRPTDAVARSLAPDVAYLEVDGVLPMTRELDPARCVPPEPKARGGKGNRYKLEGREVKNAVLYTGADHAQEMPSRGCLLRKRYVSYLGHWMQFALLVWLAMLQIRFDQAKLLVVLGDGAEWIRSLARWLPIQGKVVLILDFFHAAHRIWEVARLLHGDGTIRCRERARMWCEVVEQGHVAYVIRELRELRDVSEKVQEKIDELATYFDNNKDRMDYPAYVERGLRITSGIVESANFHVTGARLKQQGMRWQEKGARELALLRADLCSDRWAVRSRQLLAA